MTIDFTDEERVWLYEGIPINSTTMSKAVPHQKLRELLDFRKDRLADWKRIQDAERESEKFKAALKRIHVEADRLTWVQARAIAYEALYGP